MRYFLNYQQQPKGAARPLDEGQTIEVEVDDKGFALIPGVGDFVSIDHSLQRDKEMASFHGRVKSRLFRYVSDTCMINIVVAETDDDWGQLVKE